MERALQSLTKTLEEGAEFVQEFSDSSTLGRFWHNSDHQEKFKELNSRLSDTAHDLDLALNIASVFDQQQDVLDRHADLAEILSKLDQIALEMVNQQQELLKQHKNMKDEFKRRFDSFKFSLRQDILKAQNPVEAIKMEEESKCFLHIPYYDLVSEEQIGQGGFANVYKGTWLSRCHPVAIKTIRITYLTDSVKQTVLNEIATMYKIRFDHVLSVFGACLEPDYYALVVEFMSLGSLFDVLQKKEHICSWKDRWSIALQMTKGVNCLHEMSILHCDIKSLNFLMKQVVDGYLVKISDFGLAKLRQETSRQTTERIEQVTTSGTLQWKAPELLKFGKPSKASDIYSLGVVFWELATRCVPYQNSDDAIICQGVKAGDRLEIPADVPHTFASMISTAWSQEPTERPTAQTIIIEIMINSLVISAGTAA
jgi:tRNA A-37 threonylcarbamoyl transferase component Bud32